MIQFFIILFLLVDIAICYYKWKNNKPVKIAIVLLLLKLIAGVALIYHVTYYEPSVFWLNLYTLIMYVILPSILESRFFKE